MKGIKEFYFIIAAFIAGIIAKIVFLNKGNRKETKKTIKNIVNKVKTDKEKMHELDLKITEKINEINSEKDEVKRLNKIADLFKD
jgi:hypothetical protein